MKKIDFLIAGSGMMALSIGDYLVDKGKSVCWVSGSDAQVVKINGRIGKRKRRIEKYFPEEAHLFRARCEKLHGDVPHASIIIESTNEDKEKKRQLLGYLHNRLGGEGIYCSNSSSILPEELLTGCIGCHFFYPVSLSNCVEVLQPENALQENYKNLSESLKELELVPFHLSREACFLMNRILLPLQSKCMEALQTGFSGKIIDEITSEQFGTKGQLAIMDAIGFDTLYQGIKNLRRYPPLASTDYSLLTDCLEQLILLGKKGKKNKNGFLLGSELPWESSKKTDNQIHNLQEELMEISLQTNSAILQGGLMDREQLESLYNRVLGAEIIVQE